MLRALTSGLSDAKPRCRGRLLGIGLPLTILLGAVAALALFGSFSLSEALILGVILAPTDAGLGSAVVTDARLPLRVRQSLNVESGLNDGICVPLLLIVLATASGTGGAAHPLHVVGEEIGYGLLGGVAGRDAGRIDRGTSPDGEGLIDDAWRQIIPVAAAAFAYGVAVGLGGSGFIAAFVAGILFGAITREEDAGMMRFTEETGRAPRRDHVPRLRSGAPGPALEHVSWQIALYAVLSLTIVRMLPVAISLWGTRARAPTVAFIGWFGPRGLASIVFAVVVEDTFHAHTGDDPHGVLSDRGPVGAAPRALRRATREPLRRLVSGRCGQAPAGDRERARARAPHPGPRNISPWSEDVTTTRGNPWRHGCAPQSPALPSPFSCSNGSGAAPFGACASKACLASSSTSRRASVTTGKRGSSSINVCTSTAAEADPGKPLAVRRDHPPGSPLGARVRQHVGRTPADSAPRAPARRRRHRRTSSCDRAGRSGAASLTRCSSFERTKNSFTILNPLSLK